MRKCSYCGGFQVREMVVISRCAVAVGCRPEDEACCATACYSRQHACHGLLSLIWCRSAAICRWPSLFTNCCVWRDSNATYYVCTAKCTRANTCSGLQ